MRRGYEALRHAALSAERELSDARAWGMTLFLRQGFAGWCQALSAMRRDVIPTVETQPRVETCRVPESVQTPLVAVLAQLVLQRYREAVA